MMFSLMECLLEQLNDGKKFVKQIKEKRRENQLPIQMSFREDEGIKTIYISTEAGRVLRPLIIVENGISKLKNEHLSSNRTRRIEMERSY